MLEGKILILSLLAPRIHFSSDNLLYLKNKDHTAESAMGTVRISCSGTLQISRRGQIENARSALTHDS